MPRTSLSLVQRREMTLRALRGENMAALGREYGVDRRTVEYHRRSATAGARERYEEAVEEMEYRRRVLELLEVSNAKTESPFGTG